MADDRVVIRSILDCQLGCWNHLLLLGDNIRVDLDGLDWAVKLGHLGLRCGELLWYRLHHYGSLLLGGLQIRQQLHMLLPLLNLYLFQIWEQTRIVVRKHQFSTLYIY